MRSVLFLICLATGMQAVAADTIKAADNRSDAEKLICRRETPVGSLIATRKVCLTKSQWVDREKDGNEAARRLVGQGTGRCVGAGSEC